MLIIQRNIFIIHFYLCIYTLFICIQKYKFPYIFIYIHITYITLVIFILFCLAPHLNVFFYLKIFILLLMYVTVYVCECMTIYVYKCSICVYGLLLGCTLAHTLFVYEDTRGDSQDAHSLTLCLTVLRQSLILIMEL